MEAVEKVTLVFAKGKHPFSYLIRMRYQSRWSHVGILIDGEVHEAVNKHGVVKTSLAEFIRRYGSDRIGYTTMNAEPGWRERAEEMLGVDYDFWGAFGMGLGTRKLDNPNKVWCSHHVGYVVGAPRPERLNRLSPEHLWIFTRDAA